MDSALKLRLAVEGGQSLSPDKIADLLEQSLLVRKLTGDFFEQPLFAVFRMMGLCEIPHIEDLPYTPKLVQYINQHIATEEGFSCLGGIKELVPCYNAMLLEAYSKIGLAKSPEAQAALQWIKQYQIFERGSVTSWPHSGICKHGGCMGKVPCYIGIGKTVRALISYQECIDDLDSEIELLIDKGTEYMLRHHMYQRLTNRKPISPHITEIMMPQSYALSLTDLVYIGGKRRLTAQSRFQPLMELLKDKEIKSKQWKIDYLYSYKGYIGFENRRKSSEWILELFSIWLS